jgi:hypothetical protein
MKETQKTFWPNEKLKSKSKSFNEDKFLKFVFEFSVLYIYNSLIGEIKFF